MIKLNGEPLAQEKFPDGTPRLSGISPLTYTISWYFDAMDELFTVACIARHLHEKGLSTVLHLPYVPNARMDRVKETGEVFTLKYFCEFINGLHFDSVKIFDPHSSVAAAQSVNGRVANTCNLSEDWVGYSTLFGDNAGQFAPLKAFTATEVKAIGRELGLPQMFLEKPPADDLCGRTDEENLGFSYAALDRYIRENICEDKGVKQKIDALHAANQFKEEFVRLPFFPPGREIFYHGEQPCQTLTSSSQTIIKRS